VVARDYLSLNRLDDVKTTPVQAHAHNLDALNMHLCLYQVGFLQHDTGLQREAAFLRANGYEEFILQWESDTPAFYGKFVSARELTRRAFDASLRSGHKEIAASYKAHRALREAWTSNLSLATFRRKMEAPEAMFAGKGLGA
jgi:hypothetical protein